MLSAVICLTDSPAAMRLALAPLKSDPVNREVGMLRAILVTLALTLSAVPASAGALSDALLAELRGDYETAVRLYRKAAEQGDALAQSELGAMYFNGQGVPRDDVLAYMWLDLAAAQGSQDAPEGYDASLSFRRVHVAKFMTREQIAEAQGLARVWTAKHQ